MDGVGRTYLWSPGVIRAGHVAGAHEDQSAGMGERDDGDAATHEIGTLLQRLNLQQHTQAFEEEELTEVYLLRSMGDLLLDNLAQLGLDKSAARLIAAELDAPPLHLAY